MKRMIDMKTAADVTLVALMAHFGRMPTPDDYVFIEARMEGEVVRFIIETTDSKRQRYFVDTGADCIPTLRPIMGTVAH